MKRIVLIVLGILVIGIIVISCYEKSLKTNCGQGKDICTEKEINQQYPNR